LFEHPELVARDCATCREYFFDDATGEIKLGPDRKTPIKRQKPPTCEACPRWDAETKRPWPGFTDAEWTVLGLFRFCVEFNCLPRAGGAEDQEPETMITLVKLKQIRDQAEAGERAQHEADLMALIGRKK